MLIKSCLVLCLLWQCSGLELIQMNGTYDEPIRKSVNSSVEYVIEFSGVFDSRPPVVQLHSSAANPLNPIMVVVRQPKSVLSWQVPLAVDNETGVAYFFNTSRTLCYDEIAVMGENLRGVQVKDNPIISVSTAYQKSVDFELLVKHRSEFLVQPGEVYDLEISPSTPMFYFYNFSTNLSNPEQNFETVILEIQSNDSVCMVVSIQNASCPILDLNHDITYSGFYETIDIKGGITIPKDKFPNGFYIVFVARGSDYDCTGTLKNSLLDRNKSLWFRINPSISYSDYVNAVFFTLGCIAAFYVMFGVSFFVCSRRGYRPRAMQFVEESDLVGTPTTINTSLPDDNISLDETEYDTAPDIQFDREIFLNKPVIYLNDLARKDPRVLSRKSYLYLYNVLTVAVFYGLPVVQLVFTYQNVLNETGQQDLCYYNFLCAHPLGFFSDFNHLFSNVGYVLFGLLFLGIVHRREVLHQDLNFDRQYGIPQHYGLFYAMGVALIMEGILSASYHICPNHSNFQFDSSFMYVMAILCMIKLYQNRHPDINANAYATFLVLAVAILLGMIGLFQPNIYFLATFTVIHLLSCLYLTLQVYYMGCWRLDRSWFLRMYRFCAYEFWSGHLNVLRPKYLNRMVFLIIANISNWALAFFGLYTQQKNFAVFLLMIFMANTLLYFLFYTFMKLLHRERVNIPTVVFLALSTMCAVSAMYFFLNKSISWAETPAQSRHFNQRCALLRFYDYHDIWHFLSAVGMFFTFMVLLTLDDDLSHTHRNSIHVF